jgi:hypothetical protein
MTEHPFRPGARVAVSERYSDEVSEAFVEKVYKTGNFTLRGSKKQWRPWQYNWGDTSRWSATETGSGWSRGRLDLWDETTDAELSAKIAEKHLKTRWREIKGKLDAVKHPTPTLCDAIEAALSQGLMPDAGAK